MSRDSKPLFDGLIPCEQVRKQLFGLFSLVWGILRCEYGGGFVGATSLFRVACQCGGRVWVLTGRFFPCGKLKLTYSWAERVFVESTQGRLGDGGHHRIRRAEVKGVEATKRNRWVAQYQYCEDVCCACFLHVRRCECIGSLVSCGWGCSEVTPRGAWLIATMSTIECSQSQTACIVDAYYFPVLCDVEKLLVFSQGLDFY